MIKVGREWRAVVFPETWDAVELRLPLFLVEIGLASSRSQAERLIKAGAVYIEGEKITQMKATYALL